MAIIETEFTPSSYPVPGRPIVGGGIGGGAAEIPELEVAEVTSLFQLGFYLQSADPAYYTDKRLNSMTKNDMRYAHRMLEGIDSVVS